MKEWIVDRGEKDQRFNKYLQRKLPGAPTSFLYKMLRKKNITLNGKKASGSELLLEGDLVTLFLSDDTIAKFGGVISPEEVRESSESACAEEFCKAYRQLKGRVGEDGILYEDKDVLMVKKPVGILTQKAADSDRSMNEWLLGYLLEKGETDPVSLRQFRPSVCNRLDRNTGGILICAKTLTGARETGALLREHSLRKFYTAAVLGTVRGSGDIEGYLTKDRVTNTVNFKKTEKSQRGASGEKSVPANEKGTSWTKTKYRSIVSGSRYSLLELELITGRTHQIRSHLAALGHPILGDPKYGDLKINEKIRSEYGLRGQMLWCSRLEFPHIEGDLAALSERTIVCEPPPLYRKITGCR